MRNILLIEPAYRSKFPPLGLLRISTYHKKQGDNVAFVRGNSAGFRDQIWDKIYISSLYTWELPRTVKSIKYYYNSVLSKSDIIVGGIAATLMPQYISDRANCTIIKGPVNRKGKLGINMPAIYNLVPDYELLNQVDYQYKPDDAFFCRITLGCIRKCNFCAVCQLEPEFIKINKWWMQIENAKKYYGEKQNLVFLDNNILALDNFEQVIYKILNLGFTKNSKISNRQRTVDFNQGIDARLISPIKAKLLSRLNLKPVRLAFDNDSMKESYTNAVTLLAKQGFRTYTNYLLYNFNDSPSSLYKRLKYNIELSDELGISITGFPMRYVPINDINRQYVSSKWFWRYLRGLQCILQATHGVVSPMHDFFNIAFGEHEEEFFEILSMPDRYIIYREKYKNIEAKSWKQAFRKLSTDDKIELFNILEKLNKAKIKNIDDHIYRKYREVLEHYYPNGKVFSE